MGIEVMYKTPELYVSEWEKLDLIIQSWIGTPYKHLTMVKQRGADCTLFLAAILKEAGILRSITHDYYPRDWHVHTNEEKIRDGLSSHLKHSLAPGYVGRMFIKKIPDIQRGDLLGFKEPRANVTHHAAIVYDHKKRLICHCLPRRGVYIGTCDKFWNDKITTLFRIYER